MAEEWKAVPVAPSALISVNGTNFASMRDVNQLKSMQASAPGIHRAYDRGATGGALLDDEVGRSAQTRYHLPTRSLANFGIGAQVKDKTTNRKGVIIQAKAGYTKKSKTPVHKISDSRGKTWLGKETDLQLIL